MEEVACVQDGIAGLHLRNHCERLQTGTAFWKEIRHVTGVLRDRVSAIEKVASVRPRRDGKAPTLFRYSV